MLKRFFLCCWLLAALAATDSFGQLSPSQLESHRSRVETSRRLFKTIWSYDTVFHAGEPYAVLRPVGRSNRDFSVFALENPKEQILIQNMQRVRQGGIEVQFRFLAEPGGEAIVRSSLNVRDFICNVLYDEKLMTPRGLNAEAVEHFRRKYDALPIDAGTPKPAEEMTEEQEAVEPARVKNRSRSAEVFCLNGRIEQDGLNIGSWREEADPSAAGGKQIVVFDAEKNPVASVLLNSDGGLLIVTARDHQDHILKHESSEFRKTDYHIDAAVRYLIRKFYL